MLALALATPAEAQDSPGQATYDQLVRKYASIETKTRGVRYEDWKANADDTAALSGVLNQWAQVDPRELRGRHRQAFYINLYNATVLDLVLQSYPIETITKLREPEFAIFEAPLVRLNGEKISLNELEKKRLMSEFRDARNHFAVNCASESCPPLANFAFDGKNLEDQLNFVTRKFCASSYGFRIDSNKRQLQFSKVFEWYARDFAPESAHRYITRVLGEYLPGDYEETWMEYDWALNDASGK